MSVPKKKLNELIDKIKLLDENDAEKVVVIIEDFIKKKQSLKRKKPSDYIGALKHLDVDVEKECNKMREEWEHRGWESIS